MKTKTIVIVLGSVIVSTILFIVAFKRSFEEFLPNLRNKSLCENESMAKQEQLQGLVLEKFRDKKNHNYRTLRYQESGIIKESTILVLDESGAYDHVTLGDSIIKYAGTTTLEVYRNGAKKTFKLTYGCK